ncbi:MAG TPA: hybrid sensor histidine kinase/response regulator [Opitutaceae bacterium]|nr:hybrid sensor histidine kinase/response regulator [Opitutaceae bacterium]
MPKILVIDDEESMRQLLTRALERAGHEVVQTGSGQVGVELAPSEKPDLILCDVGLLDTTGYEVLRRVRERPETQNIPFVLMTGVADLQGMREGMRLGADDYVPKPFDLPDLLALIAARLRKAEELRRDAEDKARLLRSHISMMLPQELLTPLSGIIGLADILRDDADRIAPGETAEIGRDIQSAGERLHRLVRNFLIYSQLELLTVEQDHAVWLRQIVPCHTQKILPEIAERVAERHHRRADLHVTLLAAELAVSDQNFAKLAEELLDNAFRYSPAGCRVELHCRITGDKFWLTIADEGPGIPADVMASVRAADQFERIFGAKQTTGLGLAIAVKLAELHQGRALIQTQPGTGTSILVELPLATKAPVVTERAV